MPDILITEFMDEGPVRSMEKDYDLLWDVDLWDQPEKIKELITESRALIVRNRTQVTPDILDAAPNLKVVGRVGVGLDNIDLEACAERDVKVCPATGANSVSVAEYAICAAMMMLRGAFYSKDRVLAGEWPRTDNIGHEARGHVLGVLGFGAIGRTSAKMAQGLGMQVIAHDPFVAEDDPAWKLAENVSFDDVLSRSDVITVHVPLLPETRGLINAQALGKMKKGAMIINTARGGIIDEEDLVAALKSGHLGGAALDVFDEEPLSAETAKKFADAPNLILTPHISGVTEESNKALSEVTEKNVRAVLEGGA